MYRHWTILSAYTQSCNTSWGLEFLWSLRSRNARLTDVFWFNETALYNNRWTEGMNFRWFITYNIKRYKKAISAFERCITWSWYHLFFPCFISKAIRGTKGSSGEFGMAGRWSEFGLERSLGTEKDRFFWVESDFSCFFCSKLLPLDSSTSSMKDWWFSGVRKNEKIGDLVESEKTNRDLRARFLLVDICSHMIGSCSDPVLFQRWNRVTSIALRRESRVAGGDSVSTRREKFEEDKDEDDEQNFGNSKSFVPAFWQFSSLVWWNDSLVDSFVNHQMSFRNFLNHQPVIQILAEKTRQMEAWSFKSRLAGRFRQPEAAAKTWKGWLHWHIQ